MKQFISILLILVVAASLSIALILLKPEAEKKQVTQPVTEVTVIEVTPETVQLTIQSQGTVLPVTETDISLQVSGRIIEVSECFREGCFVTEGTPLLRIEKEDYEAALALCRAELAQARLSLATEEALANQARLDWQAVGSGKPSDLTLRKPQMARAKAVVESAQAAVEKAQRDLQRTTISAPYDAYILKKYVDLGQFVSAAPSTPAARIFKSSKAEVRLPVSVEEALHLEQPDPDKGNITLYRDTPQGRIHWQARLARTEATIDPSSRLLHVIAELDDPFGQSSGSGSMPLKRGIFVLAEIKGRTLENVYSLPRYALRGSDSLYIVTPDNTLVRRTVEIIKSDAKSVIIGDGLSPGEKVAASPIAYFSENMPVQVIDRP